MIKAIRTQTDGRNKEYSLRGAIDFTGSRDLTRQEDKDNADINIMLTRFGVTQQQKNVSYGEQDFTIDLQQGLEAIEDTKRVYDRMPKEITDKYSTYESWLKGMRTGAVQKEFHRIELEERPKAERITLERELEREAAKQQIVRDREAAAISERIKRGDKFDEKPNKPQT